MPTGAVATGGAATGGAVTGAATTAPVRKDGYGNPALEKTDAVTRASSTLPTSAAVGT